MSTPYTPGPWKTEYRKGADAMYRTEIFSEQHGGIATCAWTPNHCGNGVTETYREANARLIAAAPELLEALIAITTVRCDGMDPTPINEAYEKADAAIAKATGEPA